MKYKEACCEGQGKGGCVDDGDRGIHEITYTSNIFALTHSHRIVISPRVFGVQTHALRDLWHLCAIRLSEHAVSTKLVLYIVLLLVKSNHSSFHFQPLSLLCH